MPERKSSILYRLAGCALVAASLAAGGAQAGAATFGNPAPVTIPRIGEASPYPSLIRVSAPSLVLTARVRLHGLSHSSADDLDILLVGPTTFQTMVMSDACGRGEVSGDFTFSELADDVIPGGGSCAPGEYLAEDYGARETSFPDGSPPPLAGPYHNDLSFISGSRATGTWRLYVVDDSNAHAGLIAGGWSLELATDVGCGDGLPDDPANQGTDTPDVLLGTGEEDTLIGLGGNDRLLGLAGRDQICGGAGDDVLVGGPGKDVLIGGPGRDRLVGGGGKDKCIGGGSRDKAKKCEKRKSI